MPRKPKKPRNPVAFELLTNPLFRSRKEPSKEEKTKHLIDAWDRNRKHKGRRELPADCGYAGPPLQLDQCDDVGSDTDIPRDATPTVFRQPVNVPRKVV